MPYNLCEKWRTTQRHVCMNVYWRRSEHDICCLTCTEDSLKPAEAAYAMHIYMYVYRLERFVVLLPSACTGHNMLKLTRGEEQGLGLALRLELGKGAGTICCKLTAHLDGRPTWRALTSCQIWVHRLWILMASHGSMNRPADCYLWRISALALALASTRHMQSSRTRTGAERVERRKGKGKRQKN